MKDYPIIKISLLFAAGILFEKYFVLEITFLILITGLILFFVLLTRVVLKNNFTSHLIFFFHLLVLISGAVSYSISLNSIKPYPFQFSKIKDTSVYGCISSIELDRGYEIRFLIETDSIETNDIINREQYTVMGRVRDDNRKKLDLIYARIKVGNKIKLTGTLSKGREQRNPGEFDYQKYLEIKGISGIITAYNSHDLKIYSDEYDLFWSGVFDIRKAIDRKITELHNDETAGLLKGLILADKSEISNESKTDFINTGVVHILAVSGSNVALILLMFQLLVGRFNIVLRSVLTLICLVVFLLITGSSPSVVRAAIMGMVFIIAYLLNRKNYIYNSLALSGLIILMINPMDLFDAGFQLSFSAVLSIVILVPFMEKRTMWLNIKNKWIKNLVLLILVSFAAQIGTLPFTLYYFGRLSLVSILANVIVVPAILFVTGISIFTLILNIIWGWGASVFIIFNEFLTSLIFDITNYLGGFKYSYLSISSFSILDALVFYIFLAISFCFYEKFPGLKTRIVLVILVILNIIFLSGLDDKKLLPDGVLSVMAIDVGQGDAIIIKFPNNQTALVDAGETNRYLDNGERVIIPLMEFLGIDKIDYGFISHIDSDHYSGFISLIEKNKIGKLYKPCLDSTQVKDIKFENYLRKKKIQFAYYNKQNFSLGNAKIYMLSKADINSRLKNINDRSGVIKINYGRNSLLFVGDLGFRGEKYFLTNFKEMIDSDVLKVSHHGSKNGSGREFLESVSPEISIISAGVLNRYNYPNKETLERLKEVHSAIYRTDIEGAVLLHCNGNNIKKINWREF